jgi:hypothetical protein
MKSKKMIWGNCSKWMSTVAQALWRRPVARTAAWYYSVDWADLVGCLGGLVGWLAGPFGSGDGTIPR